MERGQEDNAKKNGYDFVVKNIEFSRFRVNKNFINWLCKSRVSASCSASITIENDKVSSHTDIYKAVEVFQREEVASFQKYKKALAWESDE